MPEFTITGHEDHRGSRCPITREQAESYIVGAWEVSEPIYANERQTWLYCDDYGFAIVCKSADTSHLAAMIAKRWQANAGRKDELWTWKGNPS